MRSLVVGAGSIGERHARVLRDAGHEVAVVSRRSTAPDDFASISAAIAGFAPEYVVVATETAAHETAVRELIASGFGGRLLVEKPLAVPAESLAAFSHAGVGFTLRFHPVVAMLRDLLAGLEIHTVEAYAGQHLGGWRPSRPVAEQYSAHRAQGGGVLRDLSHEFDYLGWMLGPWRGVFARGGRLTELTVDADDAWGIVAEYERAPVVTLQLNYLDSETRRRLVVNTSEGTIAADLIAGTVRAGGETHTLVVDRDDMFVRLHAAMTGSAPGDVTSPAEAEATDRLIAAIETSAAEKRWVSA